VARQKSKMIPVINIKNLHSNETLRALDSACRNWGAFQVIDHGIDNKTLKALHNAMHVFFKQSGERKQLVSRNKDNPWGFYDRELTKNTQDWKEIYDYGPADNVVKVPQWPNDLPEFQLAVIDAYEAFETLSFKILAAISANLGVAPQQLAGHFLPSHSSFLRLNYYPLCPAPENPKDTSTPTNGHLGVNQHTDAGCITLLMQDKQPGLEIFKDNRWHLMEAREDALLIHLGDIVQVWSNDRYKAPLHRVRANQKNARFSAPFFFNPEYTTDYAPLPSMIDTANPPRYHTINWGEFRDQRANGDYANYGEEIQISDYKVQKGNL